MTKATTELCFCFACGGERELRRERRTVEYQLRGETVQVVLPVMACTTCGTEEVDPAFTGDPVRMAYDLYRQRHGLLDPDRIKSIREQYRLSQKSFAALLGMSEATVNRYEGGALQEATHDNLIRACETPEFVRELLSRRGGHLSDWQRKRVEKVLATA
ncbi:MAG: type II TA system antitoxin MqsA family protein [Pirellulales bacterium]